MNRRGFLGLALGLAALPATVRVAAAEGPGPRLTVARAPGCGCCGAWAGHMAQAGFRVEMRDMAQDELDALKARLGLRPGQTSCHTAMVEGYVVEGHVPAEDVMRLLAERPGAVGLAVPGMPVGSPGMEMGDRRDPYDTLLIRRDGTAEVFASWR